MAIAAGLLATSVLVWGTEYKVSLYPAQQRESREPVPFAKLLSEKERPVASHGIDAYTAVRFAAAAVALLLLFAPAIRDPRLIRETRLQRLRPRSDARQVSSLSYFWFRPPPAFAF